MADTLAQLAIGAFLGADEQDRAYQEAFNRGGGKIDFGTAVEIAARRFARIQAKLPANEIGVDCYYGLVEADKYLADDGIWDENAVVRLIAAAKNLLLGVSRAAGGCPHNPRPSAPSVPEKWRQEKLLGIFKPPPKPPGSSPYEELHRDRLVVAEIRRLEKYGVQPTRNSVTRRADSACDVVSVALGKVGLGVGYKKVERIWLNRSTLPVLRSMEDVVRAVLQIRG